MACTIIVMTEANVIKLFMVLHYEFFKQASLSEDRKLLSKLKLVKLFIVQVIGLIFGVSGVLLLQCRKILIM